MMHCVHQSIPQLWAEEHSVMKTDSSHTQKVERHVCSVLGSPAAPDPKI